MTIDIPNTHAIFDPSWAKARVRERYSDAIALGGEMTRYGADLLMRAMESAGDDRGRHILITVLVRQVLAAFDGCVIGLENGSDHSLSVHSRLVMESRWALVFGLRDPAKWGRHLYVASRRHQQLLLRRAIPGTVEFVAYEPARDLVGDAAAALPPGGVAQQEGFVAEIDKILAAPDLAAINAMFEQWLSARKYEAYWFYDGPNPHAPRLESYADLATEVGCRGEYLSIYHWSSLHIHGGDTMTHFHYGDEGVAVAPLRTPGDLRHPFLLAATIAADCFRRVIEVYRPGELQVFLRQYLTEWRARLQRIPVVDLTLRPSGSV